MIENKVWSNNPNQFVIGADEVGRGSFAGPIVGAAVKINKSHEDLLVEVKPKKLCEKSAIGTDGLFQIISEIGLRMKKILIILRETLVT